MTPGLGGWVSLGPYFFLGVFIDFWHNLSTIIDKSTSCTMWESADPQSVLLEL